MDSPRSGAIAAAAASVVSAAILLISPTSASADPQPLGTSNPRLAQAKIDRFRVQHPADLVGLNKLLIEYGGRPMTVRISGVGHDLTADQAQKELARRATATSRTGGSARPHSVPVDAFTVSIQVYGSFVPSGGRIVTGRWNFRDNYVNGSAPDDMSAITTNLANGCYTTANASWHAYDYKNNDHSGQGYLYSGGSNGSPILGIRDKVSGFALLTDHGDFTTQFNPVNSGCKNRPISTDFYYEHTQDGNSTVSAGAGWDFFSVSVGGGASVLRKSTQATTY